MPGQGRGGWYGRSGASEGQSRSEGQEEAPRTRLPAVNPGSGPEPLGSHVPPCYTDRNQGGRIKSPVQRTMVSSRAGPWFALFQDLNSPNALTLLWPLRAFTSPSWAPGAAPPAGVPQHRGGGDACSSGSAHLPITSAGDSPSSQLEKLGPWLQATGELWSGQSGWAWPWLSQQPGPTGSHIHFHLHAFGPAAQPVECPPNSGIGL